MKWYFIFVIIFIFVIPTFAQVELGFAVGVNSTNFDGRYKNVAEIDAISIGSFSFGGMLVYNFNQNIALQLETLFCEKGGKNGLSGLENAQIVLEYIEIPILVKYSFDIPYILCGIYYSSTVSAVHDFTDTNGVGGRYSTTERSLSITEEIKDSDTGLCIGIGANIPTGRGKFIIQGQYTMGFNNILSLDESNGSLKNRGFHLKLGFLFSL